MAPPRPRQPVELSLSRAASLFGRALRRRCPSCGRGALFSSWFTMVPRCPHCGLRPDRGEEDYFLGAYLFNLVFAELLFAGVFVAVLLATWPDPPWTLLQYGSAVLVVLAPIALYPFSKTLWLAFDLMLRPATPAELRGDTAP